ncbi:hypothetical protein RJ55_07960 [Drechmeria coniospora]|nr:hypothetical protein RJ55_07960 [Drechmeria coniospora]
MAPVIFDVAIKGDKGTSSSQMGSASSHFGSISSRPSFVDYQATAVNSPMSSEAYPITSFGAFPNTIMHLPTAVGHRSNRAYDVDLKQAPAVFDSTSYESAYGKVPLGLGENTISPSSALAADYSQSSCDPSSVRGVGNGFGYNNIFHHAAGNSISNATSFQNMGLLELEASEAMGPIINGVTGAQPIRTHDVTTLGGTPINSSPYMAVGSVDSFSIDLRNAENSMAPLDVDFMTFGGWTDNFWQAQKGANIRPTSATRSKRPHGICSDTQTTPEVSGPASEVETNVNSEDAFPVEDDLSFLAVVVQQSRGENDNLMRRSQPHDGEATSWSVEDEDSRLAFNATGSLDGGMGDTLERPPLKGPMPADLSKSVAGHTLSELGLELDPTVGAAELGRRRELVLYQLRFDEQNPVTVPVVEVEDPGSKPKTANIVDLSERKDVEDIRRYLMARNTAICALDKKVDLRRNNKAAYRSRKKRYEGLVKYRRMFHETVAALRYYKLVAASEGLDPASWDKLPEYVRQDLVGKVLEEAAAIQKARDKAARKIVSARKVAENERSRAMQPQRERAELQLIRRARDALARGTSVKEWTKSEMRFESRARAEERSAGLAADVATPFLADGSPHYDTIKGDDDDRMLEVAGPDS